MEATGRAGTKRVFRSACHALADLESPFTESLQVTTPRPLTGVVTVGNLAHTSKHALAASGHIACASSQAKRISQCRPVQIRFLNAPPITEGSFRFPPVRRVVRMRS